MTLLIEKREFQVCSMSLINKTYFHTDNIFYLSIQFVNRNQPVLLRTIGPGAVSETNFVDNEDVTITRSGNTCNAFIKERNIQVFMSWRGTFMNRFRVFVPRSACAISFGHVGKCDGIVNNDISGSNDRKCFRFSFY